MIFTDRSHSSNYRYFREEEETSADQLLNGDRADEVVAKVEDIMEDIPYASEEPRVADTGIIDATDDEIEANNVSNDQVFDAPMTESMCNIFKLESAVGGRYGRRSRSTSKYIVEMNSFLRLLEAEGCDPSDSDAVENEVKIVVNQGQQDDQGTEEPVVDQTAPSDAPVVAPAANGGNVAAGVSQQEVATLCKYARKEYRAGFTGLASLKIKGLCEAMISFRRLGIPVVKYR